MIKRVGNRIQDIEPARLILLNRGAVEATTLTECLAVDFAVLLQAAIPDISKKAIQSIEQQANLGISKRMAIVSHLLLEQFGSTAIEHLQFHPSDTVRGWVCFMIGAIQGMTLPERLAAIRPLADDRHFGVREWAWIAVRQHLAAELDAAIALLSTWTTESSECLRRFASEATRPRGVWCAHIKKLKQHPEMALPILEPLRADPTIYVQNSIGNWLNDASKDQPNWVRALCERWLLESALPTTRQICKRALRTIER